LDKGVNTTLGWSEIGLRLSLTVIAGGLLGLERRERGRSAGFRTTILVCLAASASMIQANLLLGMTGKTANSFIVLDLMRLPLGILSGMGFIGGGAILRRGTMITGVTTAATLWFATVMGLCLGGGQLGLGLSLLALGLITLEPMRWLEGWLPQDHRARLTVVTNFEGPNQDQIRNALVAGGAKGVNIISIGVESLPVSRKRRIQIVMQWRARPDEFPAPQLIEELENRPGVLRVDWQPQAQ
jgi:putative Mg2+ transporter-C (MgtC) family protein